MIASRLCATVCKTAVIARDQCIEVSLSAAVVSTAEAGWELDSILHCAHPLLKKEKHRTRKDGARPSDRRR